jgi:hypothetical protein
MPETRVAVRFWQYWAVCSTTAQVAGGVQCQAVGVVGAAPQLVQSRRCAVHHQNLARQDPPVCPQPTTDHQPITVFITHILPTTHHG